MSYILQLFLLRWCLWHCCVTFSFCCISPLLLQSCSSRSFYRLAALPFAQRNTSLLSPPPRLQNDLYCVEWDVKLYYTIPYSACVMALKGKFVGIEL